MDPAGSHPPHLPVSFRGFVARALLKKTWEQQAAKEKIYLPSPEGFKVGIIGSGVSGLYAALMLQSIGIDYEIIEADPNHVGGRVFTHYFNGDKGKNAERGTPDFYDYIDIGAMRFPKIRIMDRIIGEKHRWSLVNYLNHHHKGNDKLTVKMVPYVLSDKNNPLYYNGHTLPSQLAGAPEPNDPYHFSDSNNGGLGSAVPDTFCQTPYDGFLAPAYSNFIDLMSKDFSAGFDALMKVDSFSTRAYLRETLGYSEEVISYLETMDSASGLYDEAFSESVMDAFDFDGEGGWQCVDGGTVRFIDAMVDILKHKPILNKRVTSIEHEGEHVKVTVHGEEKPREYAHVINTVPLGVSRNLNIPGLSYKKRVALRTLHYDNSVKISFHFKTRWWQDEEKMKQSKYGTKSFFGGKTCTDLPVRTIVFPSYGTAESPGVMIVSYTWAQDAVRMKGLGEDNEQMIEVCLNNLCEIYGDWIRPEFDREQTKFWDWNNEYTPGAFALYSPGQFSSLYPDIVQPEFDNRLHFAGEATSIHHAWMVGSTNSAYRSVWEILKREKLRLKQLEVILVWNIIDEVEYGDLTPEALKVRREDPSHTEGNQPPPPRKFVPPHHLARA